MTDSVAGTAGEILSRIERQSGRQLRAMIEISDRCNEVCVHCYQEQGLKGEMSTQQVKDVMDDLAQMGVLILTISGGEATLRKDFLELVAHARKLGFAVRLFTNGLTMTEQLAQALGRLALHVVEISLYSPRAEVHDFVTGVPGSFEKTVAGVRHLVRENVDVLLKTPIMSLNEHELDAYAAMAKALGVAYSFDAAPLLPREARDRAPQAFDHGTEVRARVRRLAGVAEPAARVAPPKPLDSKLCGAGEYVLIEPNGEIRPCTMLHVNLGNAARGELRTHTSSEAHALLTALRWSDVHGCRECDLRAYCGRCFAQALSEAGDALAPYASACSHARASYAAATGVHPRFLPGAGAGEQGPYRQVAEHAFEAIADRVTEADDALAARLGWIRRPEGALLPAAPATPGALVQLRRPGRKQPRLERIPEASAVPVTEPHQSQSLSQSPTA